MASKWKGPVPDRSNKNYQDGSEAHEKYKNKQKAYYYENRDKMRQAANDRVKSRRKLNQQWLINFLSLKQCADCGTGDIRILTFDHIDPSEKHANIADIVSRGMLLKHLIVEVEKCGIVCHNCHMLRTFKQLGGSFRETVGPIPEEDMNEMIRQSGQEQPGR